MNISDINSFVTFRTGASTTDYSAANRLISTNRWLHKVITMILTAKDSWDFDDLNNTDYASATTNLVANQQDYTFPASLKLIQIKRAEVTYDGSNWQRLTFFDNNDVNNPTDATSVGNTFTTSKPYADLDSNSIKLYPIPTANVTAGLKIWFSREGNEFTSGEVTTGTKEPGFDEPFHIMIGLGMCYDYFASKPNLRDRAVDTLNELLDYEARLKQFYGSKNNTSQVTMSSIYNDNDYR